MIKVVVFDYGHTLLDNENSRLYEGVVETLEYLDQKGIKIALVSGTNKEELRRQELNDFGIFPYFKYIDFSPHEDRKDFTRVLKLFNCQREEVLVVGDRITSEIAEANKLGLKTCRLLRGPEGKLIPENELEKPDYEIENISEVRYLV